MLMVETLPYSVKQYREQTTKEGMARRGGKLLAKEDVKSDLGDALLVKIEQKANGEVWRKWMFYLGDDKGSFRVSGIYPATLESEMSDVLKKAVLTARRAGSVGKVSTEIQPFTIKPAKPLKLARKDPNGQEIYAEDGRYPMADAGDLLLILAPSRSRVGVADKKKYAQERLKKETSLRTLKIGKTRKLKIDGLETWEVEATAVHKQTRTKVAILVTIIYDDVQYYISVGYAGQDRTKSAYKVFRKTMKTFKREKPKKK
jgi:hypothetical protein